ncbi:hypothetical protein [Mycolicibacterium canariasense]|uniref:hypothetical protein n=1 Tax=Mycolicibacterium canariasense TaxID=228230 RepID=UPI0007893E01|nr:hypothetical protein [Mycolicibacterium canariasense]MCV7207967.1 hypothetical protein [Mycolicibacterium canariasense]ORV04996.1 hypothetical protein AWB94_22015 [Mycolicibacterium canariasense]
MGDDGDRIGSVGAASTTWTVTVSVRCTGAHGGAPVTTTAAFRRCGASAAAPISVNVAAFIVVMKRAMAVGPATDRK